LMIMYSFIGS